MNPDEIEDSGDSVAWSNSSEIWLNTVDIPDSYETWHKNPCAEIKLPLRFAKQSYTAWHDSQNHDTPPRPRTRWTALEI